MMQHPPSHTDPLHDYRLPISLEYHLKIKDLHRFFTSGKSWWLFIFAPFAGTYLGTSWGTEKFAPWLGIIAASFIVYGGFLGILSFWCRPATITFDEQGVRETMSGKTKIWPWAKINHVSLNQHFLSMQISGWLILIPLDQISEDQAVAVYRCVRMRLNSRF